MRTTPEINDHSPTIKAERRLSPRKKLAQVVYIDLEPGNGGIVSDISRGGLGFHAVAPVQQAGPIRFWFSLGAGDRMEAIGELAWTDETKKVGGLRFTDLPQSMREQTRNYLAQSSMPTIPGGAFRDPAAAPKKSSAFLPVEPVEKEVPPSHHVPRPREAASSERSAPTIVPSLFGLVSPGQEPMWEPISAAWPDRPRRRQFLRGVITGVLVVSALLVAAFLYYTHRRAVGGSLIRIGESIASQKASPAPAAALASKPSPEADARSADIAKTGGALAQETESQMAPAAQEATTASSRSPAEAASADKTNTKGASIGSTTNPVAAAPRGHGPRTLQSANSGESQLAVAEQYLHGTYGRRDSTTGAQWLWAAVKNGSATAEVLLADLYRRGDGVPKSCEQARVLLLAASRRGHGEAMEKLRELNRYGCP